MPKLPVFFAFFLVALLVWGTACSGVDTPKLDSSQNTPTVTSDTNARNALEASLNYCLDRLGDSTDRFIQTLRLAIDANIRHLDTLHDLVLADAFHKIGIQYYQNDQLDLAVSSFEKSLKIRQLMLGDTALSVIKLHKNIGVILRGIKETEQSKIHLLKAKSSFTEQTSSSVKFETLQNLALVYKESGEYSDARDCFELAVVVAEAEVDSVARREQLAEIGNDFAILFQELGEYNFAYNKAEAALPFCESTASKANCRNTLGLACKNLGRYQEAVTHFTAAIDLFANDQNQESEAFSRNNLGTTYRLLHQYAKAKQTLLRALELNNSSKLPTSVRLNFIAGNYNNLAEVDMDTGHYQDAMLKLQMAASFFAPEKMSATAGLPAVNTASGDLLYYMDILRNYARCQFKLYQAQPTDANAAMHQTVGTYDSLVTLMARIRSQYFGEFSKIHFAAEADSILSEAVATCHVFYTNTGDNAFAQKAFVYADYSKANALLEQVKLVEGQRLGKVPPELWQEGRAIRKKLNKIDAEIDGYETAGNAPALNKARDEKLRLNEGMEANLKAIRKLNPILYGNPTTVQQVQQELLAPDQALVEYKIAGKQLYAFVISPQAFRMECLPMDSPAALALLASEVDSLRDGIVGGAVSHAAHAKYCHYAHHLFKRLFEPLQASLQQSRLLLVPEGFLDKIPFETLLSTSGDPVKSPELLLLSRYNMGYGYSAGMLLEMKKNQAKTGLSKRVAAFAPAISPALKPGSFQSCPEVVAQYLPFKPMAYSQQEIDSIANWVGTEQLNGAQASKAAFLKAANEHNVVHVSSHAFLSDGAPANSFLVFSQLQDTVQPAELLFLRELNGFEPLDIELMVFTACQTALGKNLRGEGAMSMARGLASAGVKSFVTTLWEVNQEKTAALIPGFYQHLKIGANKTKDCALADAKRQFLQKSALNRYPNFWAGLVISGDMQPIELANAGSRWGTGSILAGLLSVFGLLALLWFRRKKTSN